MIIEDNERQSVTITWKPPLDDGGVELSNYYIEKYDKEWSTWTKISEVDRTILSYTIQELTINAEYMFRVYAQNSIGTSEPLESEKVKIKSPFSK